MTRSEIKLSPRFLDLSVETGNTFESSFKIYSTDGKKIKGKILSTNDKVVPRATEFSGTECEIPFYFKGILAIPGEEHAGDFLLLTDRGEYNIPYCISVVERKYWYGDRSLSGLADFAKLAKEEWKTAREIFFTKEFPDIMFHEQEEYQNLYQNLLKGHSKDMILDHFLMETAGKEPVSLCVDKKELRICEGGQETLVLTKKGWGCLECHIYSEEGRLLIERERISADDFEDQIYKLPVSLKEDEEKDILVIETVYHKIKIPVEKRRKSGEWAKRQERQETEFSSLLRLLLAFRTGKIDTREYITKSLQRMPVKGPLYELYSFLLFLIREKTSETEKEEFEKYGAGLEERKEEYLNSKMLRSFYLYVMAMWKKDRKVRKEAVQQIRRFYKEDGKWMDYMFLLLVDENLAFHYSQQWETFLSFLEEGESSPLFYLSVLDVLNYEPYLLEQLDEKKTAVISWGMRHQYLSQKLLDQFAHLSLREKGFKRNQLPVLMKAYEKKQDDLYLKAICSMLMKGNKTGQEYHIFYEKAVERKLNLIGLYEFYLRSLNPKEDVLLPKMVLYYFHYSNSLSKREKAWLYLNIMRHREEYEDIYENYLERIEDFVKEQLIEGRMNRYLKELYLIFLPDMAADKEIAKNLPNIIFKKRLSCEHSMIEGVYVCHPESEEELYVPLVDGICQPEIYSEGAGFYFVDRMGNRYYKGISYKLESYLDEELFRDICLEYARDNRKVFTKWAVEESVSHKEQLARLMGQDEDETSWKREKAVEKILDYQYEEKTLEELSECLDRINYRSISPSYRRTLMKYYMACNRMEDAYFGVELYGSDQMDPGELYLLTCVGLYLHKEERDDLLLSMAYRTFVNRRYNREILLYLKKYLEGRVFDLLDLWSKLKKEGLEDAAYEERVLRQMLFVQVKDERILDVLLSYQDKMKNDALTDEILELYCGRYLKKILGEKSPFAPKTEEQLGKLLLKQGEKKESFGRNTSLIYLWNKAKDGYKKEDKPMIKNLLEMLVKDEIVFPYFKSLLNDVRIPCMWQEFQYFWFCAEENREYSMCVTLEEDGMLRRMQIPFREIEKGCYYAFAFLPGYTKIQAAKIPGYEGKVKKGMMQPVFSKSRNQILTRMDVQKETVSRQEDSGYEILLRNMAENLKFLGE